MTNSRTTMTEQTINGRYAIERELGQGGMGKVYLVRDTHRKDRQLALKTMLSQEVDEQFLESFRHEFAQLTKYSHPNIAANYDFGRISGTSEHFFTTEFIDGVSVFQGTQNATFDELLDVTVQLLRGLRFIHKHGMLHNDLKPANVLLASLTTEDTRRRASMTNLEAKVFGLAGKIKIIDFGLLSGVDVAWDKIRGTPRYMSPERILCQAADGRADLYSLGCMLYLLASRRYVYPDREAKRMLKKHLSVAPLPLDSLCPHLPAPYVEFVNRLIEKRPEDRFQTADEALSFLGEELGIEAAPTDMRSKTPAISAGTLLYRDDHLKQLNEWISKIIAGDAESACTVLEGEAGVGKTELVSALKSTIQIAGGAFVTVEDRMVEGHLHPVVDALIAGLRTSGASGVDRVHEILGKARDVRRSKELASGLEKAIFWYAAHAPLLIHFDDFHAASDTVRLFAMSLIQAASEQFRQTRETSQSDAHEGTSIPPGAPKLIVVISRRAYGDQGTVNLSGVHHLRIEPFDRKQSDGFLEHVLNQTDLPEGFLFGMHVAARGNPRFILEVTKSLAESDHIRHRGTRWEIPESLENIPIPASLTNAMDLRIAALGEDPRTVLAWLALARAPLATAALCHCTLLEAAKVELILDKLHGAGFLTREQDGSDARFSLAYPDLKRSFISKLDAKRLAFMHQRLAQAIERTEGEHSQDIEATAELLAHHWLAAGNTPGFLRYAPAAAEFLQRCGNFPLAVEYHRRIADALPEEAAGKKIQSLMKLSEMHEFLWDLEESERALKEGLRIGERLLRPKDLVAMLRRQAGLLIAQNKQDDALFVLRKASKSVGDTPDPALRLSLEASEIWARWFNRRKTCCEETVEKAVEEVLRFEPQNVREKLLIVSAQNYLAGLYHLIGDLSKSIELHQRNLGFLEGEELIQARAACVCSLGSALLDLGEHDAARKLLSSALEKGKEVSDRRTLARARERLGEYHLLHGDLKRALQVTQISLEDAKSIDHVSANANSQRMLGRIYMRADQLDHALESLKMAVSLHQHCGDVVGHIVSRIYLAKLYVRRGEHQNAISHIETALQESERFQLRFAVGLGKLYLAEALYDSEGTRPRQLLEEAWVLFERGGFQRQLCDVLLLRYRAAIEHGDRVTADEERRRLEGYRQNVCSNEQAAEIVFLEAIGDLERGNIQVGATKLDQLRKLATDARLPWLAERCSETMTALRERLQSAT